MICQASLCAPIKELKLTRYLTVSPTNKLKMLLPQRRKNSTKRQGKSGKPKLLKLLQKLRRQRKKQRLPKPPLKLLPRPLLKLRKPKRRLRPRPPQKLRKPKRRLML